MKAVVRSVFVACALMIGGSARIEAQVKQQAVVPPLPSLSSDAQQALEQLAAHYAGEIALHQSWFRDRQLMYYDFGAVPQPVAMGSVLWPIHGFDAQGNPVAIRGQRPIFSSLPGLPGYSGVWKLTYVVTEDHAQPNQLRDLASVDAIVRGRRAVLKETNVTYNLPIVAHGSRLARDSVPPMQGWYEGRDVDFFDFGQASVAPVPLMVSVRGQDASGTPNFVTEQANIADTLTAVPPFTDLCSVLFVHVDSGYVANSLKSAAAVRGSGFLVAPANSVRNCPVMFVDGTKLDRAASPVRAFADMRSPFPPAPTRPQ
jgi:hypothetical protein